MADADAAVAMVHALEPDSLLLIRRAERAEDPWSGHWSFPGGRWEPRDRDLLHTALRELREECGVHLEPEQLVSSLPLRLAGRRVGRHLRVVPFLFRVERELPIVLDPAEAAASVWIPLATLRDPARHSLRRIPGLAGDARYPAVDLEDGMPLWGFTYRLIADWLGIEVPGDPLPG